MKGLPEERTIRLAQYMIEQKATRAADCGTVRNIQVNRT